MYCCEALGYKWNVTFPYNLVLCKVMDSAKPYTKLEVLSERKPHDACLLEED